MAKVLIVDDKLSNLVALENVLRRSDVEIIKALSGDEALRATLNHDFALAILDVQMPVMDGYELAGLLRSDIKTRSIPIIFLSAVYSEEPYVFKGYESGAVDFITKPFVPQVLLSKVKIFLELAEQRAELVNKGARLEAVISELERQVEARRRTEEEVLRKNAILEGVNRMLREAIVSETEGELAKTCLTVAEELTGSRFCFLGEIDEEGLFHDIAVSSAGWPSCRAPGSDAPLLLGGVDTCSIRKLLKDGEPIVINDPSSHPGQMVISEGSAPLTCFMAIPLKKGEKTFGLIALANKDKEYCRDDLEAVESLAVAFVEALSRKRAEDRLRKAFDYLEEKVQARTVALKNEIEERKKVEEQIRLDESRVEALYNLSQMIEATDQQIIDFVLEGQLKITKSRVGTIDFLAEDGKNYIVHTWSKEVMNECNVIDMPMRFPLEGSGLWAQAVRKRRPVIINDYAAPHPAKKGCPEGHLKLLRIMGVPVFDGNEVAAVAVVGNKDEEYTKSDARQLSLLMDGMWKLLKQRRVEETRRSYMTKLEQSNRELEDFAFLVSHDLQEPLRKIRTFADRLAATQSGALNERGSDYLDRIERSAERMQALLRDLLKYTRVTTRPEPFTPIDLRATIDEAVTDLVVLCEETGCTVEVGEFPAIVADRAQMRQLFRNLIGNALKYRGENKPHVKVYQGQVCTGEYLQIHVTDNGIGFDECFLDKIFKPFQRLHAKSSIYQGTGMGLAICRRVVEHHGGSITARSQPGQGATFIVTLPLGKEGKGGDAARGRWGDAAVL